jgi:spore germination protein KB
LEALAVSVWIMGIFIKVSVLLFMFSISVSQLFNIQNYRAFIFPVTLLSAIGSVWIFENAANFQIWITLTYPVLAFFTQSLLPLALLIIDSTVRKFKK